MPPVIPFDPDDSDPEPPRPGAPRARVRSSRPPDPAPHLVVAACAGDPNALQCLLAILAQHAYLVANAIFRSPDLRHDCVQAALLILWQKLPSLDPSRSITAYCRTITRHEAHRIWWCRQRSPGGDRTSAPFEEAEGLVSSLHSPLQAAARAELIEILRAAIERLPPAYRRPMRMCMAGEPMASIRQGLGIANAGSFRSVMSRAYALLRADPHLAAAAAA